MAEITDPDGATLLLVEGEQLKCCERGPWDRLTPRKREILRWVVEGKTNDEVAVILEISAKAVEKHVAELCRLSEVNNRMGLAREYYTW